MERKFIPESENKLIILYALSQLGPCTAMQLLQFLVEMDLMNYFTMQLSLSDMQEQGQLSRQNHPLGDLLILTREGEYAIEVFAQRIPVSRRQLINRQAPQWRECFRLEQLAPAESFTLQDGRLCLRLRLLEGASTLMDILLTLPPGNSFTFLEKRWHSAAQTVYNTVTLTLSDGFDPALPLPASEDTAMITPAGNGEWLLTLADDAAQPSLTLLFTLADEALARHCAARWPSQCQQLQQMILLALREGIPS